MKDFYIGILLFLLLAWGISVGTSLNFMESLGSVFIMVLIKNLYDELKN